jgi:phospholipase C
MPPIVSRSDDPRYDALLGSGLCGHPEPGAFLDRCGHGLRLPLLVVSPFVRPNSVDHGVFNQASILRFIEDNWRLGRIGHQSFDESSESISRMLSFSGKRAQKVFLDPSTGQPRRGATSRRP